MTGIPYGIVPDGRNGNRWLVVSAPNTAPRRVGCIQFFGETGDYLAWAYPSELAEAPTPTAHADIESAANAIADAVETPMPARPRITTAKQYFDLIGERAYAAR